MRFINFDLNLEPRAGEGYPVLADSSKYGQARALCKIDAASVDMLAKLEAIASEELVGDDLAAFGRLLASNVLTGQVEDLFNKIVGAVQSQPRTGVRLRLRINAPELNVLPWEFLQTESGHDPVGVSTRTVLTRYIEMNEPVREVEAPRPLRMLGIIPQGSGLQTDKEKAALEKALAELGGSLQLKWLEGAVTRDRIRDALGEAEYHLVHFIGHGSMDGSRATLRLNDEYGDDYPVPAETFSGFFRDSSVRLLVLNACRGAARAADNVMKGVAPQVVRRGVPAVVAMQWDINDRVAQQFAKSFYRSLCVGPEAGEVDTAVTRGRAVLYDDWPGSKAFATPVLFLRAEDGRLWHEPNTIPTDPIERPRRFKAAMPKVSRLGLAIDVKVTISLKDSRAFEEYLREHGYRISEKDVKGTDVPVHFPLDPADPAKQKQLPVDMVLKVEAEDFEPYEQTQSVSVPPDLDSGIYTLSLTPSKRRKGARVVVELLTDKDMVVGSHTLYADILGLQDDMVGTLWQVVALPLSFVVPGGREEIPDAREEKLNIGTQISGTIAGDVTFGNKITTGANSNVVIADQGANVSIDQPDTVRSAAPGAGYAALVVQVVLWQNAVGSRIDGLSSLSAEEKKDLKDQAGKIRLESIKKEMDTTRLARLINTLGMMGGNELVELTVKRLSGPLSGIGVSLKMNTDFKVSVDRDE